MDVKNGVEQRNAGKENADHFEDESIDETLHDRQQHGMLMDTCLQPVDIAHEILDQH